MCIKQAGTLFVKQIYDNIIIIPREGVGGALGATARKPSLLIAIWRSPQRNLAESEGKFPHTGMVLRL